MRLLLTLYVFLYLCCGVDVAPTLPNIDYLGSGYDIMYGNPHTTIPTEAPDPGYRQWVFNLTIYNGDLTPDQRYQIPEGTQVSSCDACEIDFGTTEVSGTQSYQQSLEQSVSVDLKGWGAHFSASVDYKSVEKDSSSYSDVFTESKAECCVYKSTIDTFAYPPFTTNFNMAVFRMPTVYNSDTQPFFDSFFQTFGTHVTLAVTMGGRFGQKSRLSKTSWSKLVSSDLDVKIAAGYSALSFSAAVNSMTDEQKSQAQTYSSLSEDQSLFAVGGELPPDGQASSWVASAQANPMPLVGTLQSIANIVTSLYFPNDPNIDAKRSALTKSLTNYCQSLVLQGIVSSCLPPPPDPPFPPPSIFGGLYQDDDCQKDNLVNVYSKGLSCKQGYSPFKVGRFRSPEGGCGSTQYLCLLNGARSDPLSYFGGFYQKDDVENLDSVVNPLTGGYSCPGGYTSIAVGRVATAEPKVHGASQYGCFNMSMPLGRSTMAGMYQVEDTGNDPRDNVPNQYTSTVSCPDGYSPFKIGRIYAPESKVGANQFVCLNNVYQ